MAEALVGGAFLSAFLQVLFDRVTPREFDDFIMRKKLDHGLLKKLDTTLLSVYKLQDAAEEKQFTDPIVKRWLAKLKDAVYDAEDLLESSQNGDQAAETLVNFFEKCKTDPSQWDMISEGGLKRIEEK
ncbi:hypothetical protein REPUB_Repub13aG0049800 [Reevesia pubescens]